MMDIIDKYIGKTIALFVLYCIIAIVGVELIFTLIDEAGNFGQGNYDLWVALQYVMMTTPRRIYEYFPVAALAGTLIGLSTLAAHSELVILQSSGASLKRILSAVLKTAAILMVIAVILGEWLAPNTERFAQTLRTEARHSGKTVSTGKGAWIRHGQQFIHIRDIISPQHLSRITAFLFDEAFHLIQVQKIQTARHDDGTWYFDKIHSNTVSGENIQADTSSESFAKDWIKPEVLEALAVKPQTLSTAALSSYIDYLEKNQLDTKVFELAFWNKLAQPFSIAVMLFLAVPFIFGPLRSSGLAIKVMSGVLLGFGFFVLNQLLGPISLLYNFPPFLAATLPTILFFGIGYQLLKRVK